MGVFGAFPCVFAVAGGIAIFDNQSGKRCVWLATIPKRAAVRPLSECLESVDTPAGRQRVSTFLEGGPFPRYQQHPYLRGMLVRIDEHGQRTTGRFINRRFTPAKAKSKR